MRKIGAIAGAIAVVAGTAFVGAGPAAAAAHTYLAVTCAVVVLPVNLHTTADQDITVNVSAPATADSGDTVTITFPATANTLPATNTGIAITELRRPDDDVQDHGQHLRLRHGDPHR